MQHLAYAKIGEHRGHRRIYLQTRRLADMGFAPDAPYRVEVGSNHLRLIACEGGERRVCARNRGNRPVPVIDISNGAVGAAFEGANRVRVVYRQGRIEIDLHPVEAAIIERERAIRKAAQQGALASGSCCTGLGILDHAIHEGFEQESMIIETQWSVEIDPDYAEAGMDNNPALLGAMSIVGSLDEIEPHLLPTINILISGLPCNGASSAGMAKKGHDRAEDDPEVGHLFVPWLDVIKRTNPAIVVLENVVPYRDSAGMSVIRNVLDRWGYRLFEMVLEGVEYSLEDRRRFCMVAISKGIAPEGLPVVASRSHTRLSEVLENVEADSPKWRTFDYLFAKAARDQEKGNRFQQQLFIPDSDRISTLRKGYHKGGSPDPRLAHPTRPGVSRLLTAREHARIKGVPYGFVAGLSETKAHEVLGQAIIHPAFAAVGKAIACWLSSFGTSSQAIAA